MADQQKCAHPACNCITANADKYCSPYCHDAAGTTELACNCGHPGCGEELTHSA
jgi:hypothetical protein